MPAPAPIPIPSPSPSRTSARDGSPAAETVAERAVRSAFDALRDRFRDAIDPDDFRLRAMLEALGDLDLRGRRVLDLGCGKGRFARRLAERGARVVGCDPSAGMLRAAVGIPRARAHARRLPFANDAFDAIVAVEVFEHLEPDARVAALAECRRALVPGGRLLILDKNARALNVDRPWLPAILVKRIDEKRGRGMYPEGGPFRERWFHPRAFARALSQAGPDGVPRFVDVRIDHPLSPREAARAIFRNHPRVRLFVLWSARKPENGGAS